MMKKLFLVIGIVLIVLGAFCLLLSALFMYISVNTLDGSASLYHRQRLIMLIFLAAGALLLLLGILCLVLRKRSIS